jgi:hypothetical protein
MGEMKENAKTFSHEMKLCDSKWCMLSRLSNWILILGGWKSQGVSNFWIKVRIKPCSN